MIPLVARFPGLARVPRVELGRFPSPVQRMGEADDARALWVKRDDLNAPAFGGNKVRALEFLLAGLAPGDRVLTLGGDGSTHVLTTAHHAARLGLRTTAVRWRHDMSPVALAVAARAATLCDRIVDGRWAVPAMTFAWLARALEVVDGRWIPLGGTCPLGILGHVNAGMELAEQVRRGEMPAPARVVVPLGTGGTAAGLALGFAIAGLEATVVAARVGPRIGANRWRVLRLVRATAALIARESGERPPRVADARLAVAHDVYGGAYGRPLPAGDAAADVARRGLDVRLDSTYSAKALAAALALARRAPGTTLFWLTFDGRWLNSP